MSDASGACPVIRIQRSIGSSGKATQAMRLSGRRLIGQGPAARRRSARAEQLGVPRAGAPGARGSSGWASEGRLAIRQRIRAPLKLAVPGKPHQPAGHARPFGGDRKPPRGGEIEHRRDRPTIRR